MWVYVQSEPNLFTVGFHDRQGRWYSDSDHATRESARLQVSYLNGGHHPLVTTDMLDAIGERS